MHEELCAMTPARFLSRRGRKGIVEKLWQDFFSDLSQWWDHRAEKGKASFPDFKHKKTNEGLWLCDDHNPSWVEAELAAVAPGTIQQNIFSWNKSLARFVKAYKYDKALDLFQQLQREGVTPDKFTFVSVLNACASLQALEQGRGIHLQITKTGHESDVYVGTCLVDMYAKCGSIEDAERVFINMPVRDVFSWNAMILGYVKCGHGQKALDLYQHMQQEGVDPDRVTFVGALNACVSVATLEEGCRVHRQIIMSGNESHASVGASLVDMYVKCGSIADAWSVFNKMPAHDVVSWNVMILGYVKCGQGKKALELSLSMDSERVEPSPITFVGLVSACASIAALNEGRRVHEQIIQRGFESNVFVASSLFDMYVKCGSINDARSVFNKMSKLDVISWNAMIHGYVKCGQGQRALELFPLMERHKVVPDPVTFVGLLNACASVAALEEGRRVHERINRSGYSSDVFLGSCLVDMYAKCGSIEDAHRVFNNLPTLSVVSWTAMLGGYAMHGQSKEALGHFERMCQDGAEIDDVTLVSLLSACSHGGLVDEGLHHYASMTTVYSLRPRGDHHTCMVSLLGRAGRLHEAEDLIRQIACEPNPRVWMSLLGACRVHGNLDMVERVSNRVLELNPKDMSDSVLLSNRFAVAHRWDICSNAPTGT